MHAIASEKSGEEEKIVKSLKEIAQSMQANVLQWRRWLHQHPGVRYSKEETDRLVFVHQAYRCFEIADGIQVRPVLDSAMQSSGGLRGGMLFDVSFAHLGPNAPRRGFRADIDSLPIQEATNLPFASTYPGVMDACGHDAHTAMLLGALKAIVTGRVPTESVKYNLRFVFQRAEENPIDTSGGDWMVQQGVTEGIDAGFYGLHIWSESEPGKFENRNLANSGRLKITVKATGGHVAMPQCGSNAIDIGVDINVALRGFGVRHLGSNAPLSLVPAQFDTGGSSNVMPAEAVLWFSLRNVLTKAELDEFVQRITSRVQAIVDGYNIGGRTDASAEVEYFPGHPKLIQDPAVVGTTDALLQHHGYTTELLPALMGGEDFAHYLNAVPGAFWMLGARTNGAAHHTPEFEIDESVFKDGVHYWLLLATN